MINVIEHIFICLLAICIEEPGGLQSMELLRVGHDWATSLSFSLSCIGEGNGNPLQCSCLENPRDGGAWWAAVYGLAQSRTRLKRRRRSSSIPSLAKYPFKTSAHFWIGLFAFLMMSCIRFLKKWIHYEHWILIRCLSCKYSLPFWVVF